MWAYFLALSILLIILVDLVFAVVVYGRLLSNAREDIEEICSTAVSVIEEGDADEEELERDIARWWRSGVAVTVYSGDGEVLFPTSEYFISEDAAEQFEALSDVLGDYEMSSPTVYVSGGYVSAGQRIEANGATLYVLSSYSMQTVFDMAFDMQLYLLIIGVIMIILAAVVAYFFSQRFTRGVKSLSETAKKLGQGDYDVTFASAEFRELAELSDVMNDMRGEVKKSSDFQNEILANTTHDLKTPITMIKAYASMIQEISGDDPEKRNRHLQVIIDEADRLTDLINDVLDVSKINAELQKPNLKVFNLTDFLYGVINRFGYLQEVDDYCIMVDVEPDKYTKADEEQIGQVIYNLLGNAASYTGEDKTIYVSLKESMDGERVRLTVRDTGEGIDPDEIGDIWNRYYRTKNDHVRPVKGTGLGLSIVKSVLDRHGFDFGVESEKGEGTTFWVDFPSVKSEDVAKIQAEIAEDLGEDAKGDEPPKKGKKRSGKK